jgi:DNA-directed RNA polymerase subunit beta'
MGAEAVRDALAKVDLSSEVNKLQEEMSDTRANRSGKKLQSESTPAGLSQSKVHPEWMILTILPVIPPDLRPLVPLEGGRFEHQI